MLEAIKRRKSIRFCLFPTGFHFNFFQYFFLCVYRLECWLVLSNFIWCLFLLDLCFRVQKQNKSLSTPSLASPYSYRDFRFNM